MYNFRIQVYPRHVEKVMNDDNSSFLYDMTADKSFLIMFELTQVYIFTVNTRNFINDITHKMLLLLDFLVCKKLQLVKFKDNQAGRKSYLNVFSYVPVKYKISVYNSLVDKNILL